MFNTDAVENLSMNTPRDDSRVTTQVTSLKDIKFETIDDLLIDDIVVLDDFNSRKNFDEESLRSLGTDIEQKGLLQPIIFVKIPSELRPTYNNKTIALVAGERRYRAIKGYTSFSRIPYSKIYEEAAWAFRRSIMLSENSQRDDLTLIEVVDSVKVTLKEEFFNYENPYKTFIKSEVLNSTQSRPVVAICQAIEINSDFYEFLKSSGIQNYKAAYNLANAIIESDSGKMDKRKRDSLFSLVSKLRADELKIDNFAKTSKEISDWSKGKAKKPKIEVKNSPKESEIKSEAVGEVQTQPEQSKPKKPKAMKQKEFETFRDKLLKVENGEMILEIENDAVVKQITSLLEA